MPAALSHWKWSRSLNIVMDSEHSSWGHWSLLLSGDENLNGVFSLSPEGFHCFAQMYFSTQFKEQLLPWFLWTSFLRRTQKGEISVMTYSPTHCCWSWDHNWHSSSPSSSLHSKFTSCSAVDPQQVWWLAWCCDPNLYSWMLWTPRDHSLLSLALLHLSIHS